MKNMALLIDTNIVLDWILKRQPFHQEASQIIDLCMCGKHHGYLAAHSILNVFYIIRKDLCVEERKDLTRLLCNKFEIIGIECRQILKSLDIFNFKDIEDSLQIQCAIEENLDFIITRNIKDFQYSRVKALLPEDFLAMLNNTPFKA